VKATKFLSVPACFCQARFVEAYRTTVTSPGAASGLLRQLRSFFPGWCISFDLDDCDRVLRVETPGDPIDNNLIAGLLRQSGYACEPLPD
jgi:hypothetical protein